jgi:hypothetical protein
VILLLLLLLVPFSSPCHSTQDRPSYERRKFIMRISTFSLGANNDFLSPRDQFGRQLF